MIKVSDESYYCDFLSQLSGLTSELSLFCGFTLTTITLLVTRLPNLSALQSQIALFFLTVLLDFIFLLGWVMTMRTIYCRYLPLKIIKGSRIFNPLLFVCICMWGIAVVLVFYLWNLIYLALASIATWVLFIIIAYGFLWKQFKEYAISQRSESRRQISAGSRQRARSRRGLCLRAVGNAACRSRYDA